MRAKRIPVKAAKAIADAYGKDQVIIVALDKDADGDKLWFTSYGRTKKDCAEAAQAVEFWKRVITSDKDEGETFRFGSIDELEKVLDELPKPSGACCAYALGMEGAVPCSECRGSAGDR